MKGSHRSKRARAFAAAAVVAGLTITGPAAGSALASDATACGLMTQHEMAKAFGLKETVIHNFVLREPGNPAGLLHIRCKAFSWAGSMPGNSTQRRAALLEGNFAPMRIETWVPDPGPYEKTWLANFPRKLEGLKQRARQQFLEGRLDGSTFVPPHFGAEGAIGYKAKMAKTTKIRALWWTASTGDLISFTVEEANGKPILAALRTLAATMVPGVFN